MPHPSKRPTSDPIPADGVLARMLQQTQVDFEVEFFTSILERSSEFIEVLRAQAKNLSVKGRYAESMQIDQRWVRLRPADPLAHYNLACTYALLKQSELAITTLRKAVECGYRDFRHIREDRDFDSIRKDPRFRALLREYDSR